MHPGAWGIVALAAIRCKERCPFALRIGQLVRRYAERDYNSFDTLFPCARCAAEQRKNTQNEYQTQKAWIHDTSPSLYKLKLHGYATAPESRDCEKHPQLFQGVRRNFFALAGFYRRFECNSNVSACQTAVSAKRFA